jgi:prepilin-type N-terminal cleavage/methylation domain-containing protein
MKGEKGFSLIEVLVSLAILSILAVGFLGSLAKSSSAAVQIDQIDTARALAQTQMEFVKEQAFNSSGTYLTNTAVLPEYPGYSVHITAAPAVNRDSLIQKVTISISTSGKIITSLEDYKVKK